MSPIISFPLTVDEHLMLMPFEAAHTDQLFDLITRNRQHLDGWLRWSGRVQTRQDTADLIHHFQAKYQANDGFHAGLWVDDGLVGGVICHGIQQHSQKTEIGYWLAEAYVGQGLITRACQVIIRHLFEEAGLHRIEIQCATDNQRSRAVAERLGFVQEGILRESEWITTSYRDHAIYSMLDREWAAFSIQSQSRR